MVGKSCYQRVACSSSDFCISRNQTSNERQNNSNKSSLRGETFSLHHQHLIKKRLVPIPEKSNQYIYTLKTEGSKKKYIYKTHIRPNHSGMGGCETPTSSEDTSPCI